MQKWLILLCVALLLNTMHAQAEEDIYFTNNRDRYYHLNENCDRHSGLQWWNDRQVEYYEREVYQKKPISEAAALEFDKKACPVCVNVFQPVYLGEHFPEWPYEDRPWDIGVLNEEDRAAYNASSSKEFSDELLDTWQAFSEYYEEVYDSKTQSVVRRHAYPEAYAGTYSCKGGIAYRIVDPNEEILLAFERMFGSGAWIVPAKYGYNEIMENTDRVVKELQAWCAAHPEMDARFSSVSGPDFENYAVIGINGADWREAAAAMEDTAPIYIHFVPEEMIVAMDF